METRKTIFCLILLFMVAIKAGAEEKPLKEASFIPQWVPQAQFAGYYVALELGFYKKHGIDLTIIPGGPNNAPSDLLKNNRAQFGTMWLSSGIQMRAQGIRVVNIAQILQRSALMLVAKKSSGIKTPQDMDGKKVGLWGPVFQIQPKAFFSKYNLHVKTIRQSYSVNLFLRDGVDVASAMWYNEYHTILNCGLDPSELTTFFFYDHALNFPEDGIYILEENFQKDPDLARAFVRASIEGWRYAFSHPDEALTIIMRYLHEAHIPVTRVHQKWMLERMQDLIRPKGSGLPMGRLLFEDYLRVAKGLKENALLKDIPVFSCFYRECLSHDEE